MERFQVNLVRTHEGDFLTITRYSSDGYIGRIFNDDGEFTDWGIHVDDMEGCEAFVDEYCKNHNAEIGGI